MPASINMLRYSYRALQAGTMSVTLLVAAVLVRVAVLVRAQQSNFLESVAIHNEVESVRCNSNEQNFTDYYNRLQRESRNGEEYDRHYPSGEHLKWPTAWSLSSSSSLLRSE